jgi:hypothetical protein
MATATATMSIIDFLSESGGVTRFDYDSPNEAYTKGRRMRRNIQNEGLADKVTVEISNTIVRLRLIK